MVDGHALGDDACARWRNNGHYLFFTKVSKVIPAPLAGIGIVALIVIFFGLDVPRVGDMASIKGGLPSFHVPMVELSWETFEIIFPYAVVLAAIGLIESLLTLNLVGEMTNKRGGASQECLAQGTANVVTGFFGGMGGCAMIGQSMINVKSGGRTRIAHIRRRFSTAFYSRWKLNHRTNSFSSIGWCDVYGCNWNFRLEFTQNFTSGSKN